MKKKAIKSIAKLSPMALFWVCMSLGLSIWIIRLFISNGRHFYETLYTAKLSYPAFSDFIGHVGMAKDPTVVYSYRDAVYPPLCELFYYVMGLIIPDKDWYTLEGIMVNCFYIILRSVVLLYLIEAYKIKRHKYLIALTLLFSYPIFSYSIKTGNPVFMVALWCALAILFKDSEKKVLRECALLLIALAASFKMYPAIFGLLWVREKRYKESLRLIIYGIILFFSPFLFTGGISGALDFADKLSGLDTLVCFGTLPYIIRIFSIEVVRIDPQIPILIAEGIFFTVTIFVIIKTKSLFVASVLLSSVCMIGMPTMQPYYLCFALVPLLLWLKNEEEHHIILSYIMAVLFTAIMWSSSFAVEYICIWALYFLGLGMFFFETKNSRRRFIVYFLILLFACFSTVMIKIENENNIDTSAPIINDYDIAQLQARDGECSVDYTINGGLTDIDINQGDTFIIDGWMVDADHNNVANRAFFEINNVLFELRKKERSDVSNYFNNSALISSGFYGIISTETIGSGVYDSQLIFDMGDNSYYKVPITLNIIINEGHNADKNYQFDLLINNKHGGTIKIKRGEALDVEGWMADIAQGKVAKYVDIQIDNITNSLQQVLRTDVGEYYNNHNLDDSGFIGTISTEGLDLGTYNIYIRFEMDDGTIYKRETTFVVQITD